MLEMERYLKDEPKMRAYSKLQASDACWEMFSKPLKGKGALDCEDLVIGSRFELEKLSSCEDTDDEKSSSPPALNHSTSGVDSCGEDRLSVSDLDLSERHSDSASLSSGEGGALLPWDTVLSEHLPAIALVNTTSISTTSIRHVPSSCKQKLSIGDGSVSTTLRLGRAARVKKENKHARRSQGSSPEPSLTPPSSPEICDFAILPDRDDEDDCEEEEEDGESSSTPSSIAGPAQPAHSVVTPLTIVTDSDGLPFSKETSSSELSLVSSGSDTSAASPAASSGSVRSRGRFEINPENSKRRIHKCQYNGCKKV